jgi:hypothetical protein
MKNKTRREFPKKPGLKINLVGKQDSGDGACGKMGDWDSGKSPIPAIFVPGLVLVPNGDTQTVRLYRHVSAADE